MQASNGRIRADVAHDKLVALGYTGSERTTRRAVADARTAWAAGHRRVHRPWVPEPGLWFQWDFGAGPVIDGAATWLFCAWLAWSRPGGDPDPGQGPAHRDRQHRLHPAPVRWLPHLRADRQRESPSTTWPASPSATRPWSPPPATTG